MQHFHSYHHDTGIKMLICGFFIFAWFWICLVHGTLEPKDIEPDWLTLATGSTQQGQVHDAEMHVGNRQIEQGHHPHISYSSAASTTSQTERPLPIHPEGVGASRSTKYFKSSETRSKMAATWTEERKRKWGEKMKERIKYTPKFTRKGKFHTPETIEKIRKSRLAIPTKPSTKEKISNSLKKFQARRKEIEKEKAYFKSLHPTSSQPHGPSEEKRVSGQK
jgi:hypothetical protein